MSSNYQQVAIDTTTAHAQRIRQASALPALIKALRDIKAITDEDTATFRKRGGTYRGLIGVIAAEALAKAGVRT